MKTLFRLRYDPLGRMTDKQADGRNVFVAARYDYVGNDGQLRPHALSSASMASTAFPNGYLNIDYTMFDKVHSIGRTPNPYLFDYGYDHQRIRMHDGADYEKTYVGGCEFVSDTGGDKVWTYLIGPMGVFGVAETVGDTTSVHYVLKDHLGSWTTITSASGNVEQERSFDAWGLSRNPANWREWGHGTSEPLLMFDRGFTGHEHLQDVRLINMNGRMFDPVTSSFLSVDSYVQDPENAQNFNRYAYCLNNPLKYTDPSGELFGWDDLVINMAIGATVSMTATTFSNFIYDQPLYQGLGRAAAVGALQGAFSFGIGTTAELIATAAGGTWGTVAKVGFQVVAHGTLGGVCTLVRDNDFWSGFASGAVSSLIASAVGATLDGVPKAWQMVCVVASGGLSGGVTATMAGGNFWEGVCNGVICAGLNHAMHLLAWPNDPPSSTVKKIIRQKISEKIVKYEVLNYILGQKIASYTGSEFNERMFMNYWKGAGDYTLTEAEFYDIVENAVPIGDPQVFMQDGQQMLSQLVSLYGTPYDRSLGTSTLHFDMTGNPIGFNDDYDFNIWNANRPLDAQIQTIMVKYASYLNIHSKPFKIKYP